MIEINERLDCNCNYDFTYSNYKKNKLLFFDIETTGLSADVSSLYLIGCIYWNENDNSFYLKQWFADDYHEEECLLNSFFDFCKEFNTLVHYNGSGFDIPYLKKKCEQFSIPYPLDTIESLDLYRKLLPFKKLLSVPNIKQKTIETLCGLNRTDPYTGKQLIQIYGEYLHGKISHGRLLEKNCSDELLANLLLHNKEDLTGLLWITSILTLTDDLFQCDFDVKSCKIQDSMLEVDLTLPVSLPFPIVSKPKECYFSVNKNYAELKIPVTNNRVKLYFEDYKDYYYLPNEDMAIHKSLATFVDKTHRKKATKDTCYTWIELTTTFMEDKKLQADYCQKVITYALHNI